VDESTTPPTATFTVIDLGLPEQKLYLISRIKSKYIHQDVSQVLLPSVFPIVKEDFSFSELEPVRTALIAKIAQIDAATTVEELDALNLLN
jgi:hypothetical protein